MFRSRILALTILSTLALGITLVGNAVAANKLVGTWKLLSCELKGPNGEIVHPYGSSPVGLIMYDATGDMAVQIIRPDRPKGEMGKETSEEIRAAYDGYVAYFGKYTINASGDTVTHHVEGSLDTWRIGVDQVRPLTVSGNRLILRAGNASLAEAGRRYGEA